MYRSTAAWAAFPVTASGAGLPSYVTSSPTLAAAGRARVGTGLWVGFNDGESVFPERYPATLS